MYLGIDFGTSGARAIIINCDRVIVYSLGLSFDLSNGISKTKLWQHSLYDLLENIPREIRQQIKAIAIDGTSSTVLLCESRGFIVGEAILYNDNRGQFLLEKVKSTAPPDSVVNSATSSLVKLFWYQQQDYFSSAKYFLHQADWLSFLLHGKLGISDYHNALKLGYDVKDLCYPDWLKELEFSYLFPQVLAPGTVIKEVTPEASDRFSLNPNCLVCTGTTDSIAATIASGVNREGEAVTSLGSTMVLKLISKTLIENSKYGIYSHRWGNLWLTGGASNTGGAVLKRYFSDAQLQDLSAKINPNLPTNLEYYPLVKPGERFPINNPNLAPKIHPIPDDKVEFLQALLSSMAKIEALGYAKLQELGATPLKRVYSAGGGAKNKTWQQIRHTYLQVPVETAKNTEAAYGTALLALKAVT